MSQATIGQLSGHHNSFRRTATWAAILLVTILTNVPQADCAELDSVFRSDFKAALAEAEEKKLPLLIHFYADWCMPCKRMDREVFSATDVKDLLQTRFIATKVNSDQQQDLVRRYGVETLPSDVIVDSQSGRVLALHAGFQDRNGYVANISKAEAKFTRAHAGETLVLKSTPAAVEAKGASSTSSGGIELGEPKPIIGLAGFSPVAIAKNRQWNRGSPKFAWDYKEVTYYLCSREELVEFRNDPEAFAPKLLGCDPVILWESDKAVAGDIKYAAFFDDELFLFKSEERRRQFKANPEKYIRLQHALKVDQIDQTVVR
ncbi:thioredoxin family protein [Schlesneria sp. DSM 10557]|uniref:thioredoxin family protein n=1 Tax=Schlesneria sp. DSM 10557 TaxID=3044399 RepID=UPI00359FFBBD